jgi:uncharacterized membrane protein YfcA
VSALPLWVQLALPASAFGAGFIDAIAGGGGVITLPALLAAGLPPQLALGTNKGQSVFGSASALWRFSRTPLLDRRQAAVTFPLGLLGAIVGARLVLQVTPAALKVVVIALLAAVALFLALRGTPKPRSHPARHPLAVAGAVALVMGAYDGFFGPGVGTFLIAAFVALLGKTLDRASADAKAVNFASNLASLAVFAARGVVLWRVALPMAAAQAAGAWLGAHVTLRGGEKVVRPAVLLVVVALVAKLLHDLGA